MLVLTRKQNEAIVVGNSIKIVVLGIKGNTVRIGISAPDSVRILRGELPVWDAEGCDFELSLEDGFNAMSYEIPSF